MEKFFKKELNNIIIIIDMPLTYTAASILIANNTYDEFLHLIIFYSLLLIIVIRKHDSRIPIAYALIMLLISAVQLAFQNETAANNTAIVVFYLLCVGVIAQLIEYIRNPEVDDSNNEYD
jgi:uncharacterized membrane protein YhaH (DUF805 family)